MIQRQGCITQEDENVFKKGLYRSETTSNYVRLKDDGKVEYSISGESNTKFSTYAATKEFISVGDGGMDFLFEIVDKETLMLRNGEVYIYVTEEQPVDDNE